MTEQPVSAQGSAGAQLKQLLTDRVNQGLGVAAKAAGQQAGAMAQGCVRPASRCVSRAKRARASSPIGSPNPSSG